MDISHRTSDLQSLLLAQAAVAALKSDSSLIARAQHTLAHWDAVAPVASKPLRDEWREILQSGQFDRVLANTDRGQQLRQASPLARALTPAVRLQIIRSCKGRNSNT
jgi:hypothetical protein